MELESDVILLLLREENAALNKRLEETRTLAQAAIEKAKIHAENAAEWEQEWADQNKDITVMISFFKDLFDTFQFDKMRNANGEFQVSKLVMALPRILGGRDSFGKLGNYFPEPAKSIMEKYKHLVK